jgi:hypothetical protein
MVVKRLSTRSFWVTLTKQVRGRAQEFGWQLGNNTERGYAFQRWIAEVILSNEPGLCTRPEDAMLCSDDLKADLVFEDRAGSRLLIAQARYQPRGRAIVESQVSEFFDRHDKYMNREWVISHSSGLIADALLDYREKIENGYSVTYYFISSGEASSRLFDFANACSNRYADQALRITCEVFDLGRLKDYYQRSMTSEILASAGCSDFSIKPDDVEKPRLLRAIRTIVKANALRNLYQYCKGLWRSWDVKRYLVMEKDAKVVLFVTTIAVVAIVATSIVQSISNGRQVRIKRYEITFVEIQKGYSDLIEAFTDLRSSLETSSPNDFLNKTHKIESRYFAVEPFLNEKTRAELWKVVQSYIEGSRHSRIEWESARQKKNPRKDEITNSARSSDDIEGTFLSHRGKVRDLFLKAMSEVR